jgi:serine protease Do
MNRILALMLLIPFCWIQTGFGQALPKTPSLLRALSDEVSKAAEKIRPSVVTVSTVSEVLMVDPYDYFFNFRRGRGPLQGEQKEVPRGMGSGILVQGNYILTNNHVIENADIIYVKLFDGRKAKAKVVGADPHSDVAVVKVEGLTNLVPAELGDSDHLRVGDWVLAMGNPFGLELSVATGIVSAKGRADLNITDVGDFIQTSAPINPGNSGGPLVDFEGKVVGINTAIVGGGAQGLGFAIPINMAKSIMQSIIKEGKVTRGYLGVQVQEMTDAIADKLKIQNAQGVVVVHVEPGSPAAKAGIQATDIITQFGGKDVDSPQKLSLLVKMTNIGQEAEINLIRNGKPMTVKVKVAAMNAAQAQAEEKLGIEVANVDRSTQERYGYENGTPGALITRINPHSKAAASRLKEGDLIVGVNRQKITNANGYADLMQKLVAGGSDTVLLQVVHGFQYYYVLLPLK